MVKPWLEEWYLDEDAPRGRPGRIETREPWSRVAYFGDVDWNGDHRPTPADVERAILAARSPALVRLVLDVEWSASALNSYGEHVAFCCPACASWKPGASVPGVDGTRSEVAGAHVPGCALDAELTAVGLHDQASRDEARRAVDERT